MKHRQSWFKVGKRVYRPDVCGAKCPSCAKMPTEGLVIKSELQGRMAYEAQFELGYIYFDKPIK